MTKRSLTAGRPLVTSSTTARCCCAACLQLYA